MTYNLAHDGVMAIYVDILKHGCKVESVKKKWFKNKWVVTLAYYHKNKYFGKREYYLTPHESWWEDDYLHRQ